MVWTGNTQYRLAPALLTLLSQLEERWPGKGWLDSPQTGTIGDALHAAKDSRSDHNPWLDNTVRALDVAANVSGVAGIVDVHDAPDCEALFAMVNRMYAAQDPRVWPTGYAIYLRRITDPNNPGSFRTHTGDPHLYHLHISVSTNPAGYNSTAPWPLPSAAPVEAPSSHTPTPLPVSLPLEGDMILVRNAANRNQVGLLTEKGIAVLASGTTVHALAAAGVKVAPDPIDGTDFANLVRWGRL